MSKIAFIGTGGTISSLGKGPLDIVHYGATKSMLPAGDILAAVPQVHEVAEVFPVPFSHVPSPNIYYPEWKALAALCLKLVDEHPDLSGIVIGHGTATLEETAYALGLLLKVSIPVVVVGSQRPLSGLASDASMNLVNAVRVAADPNSRGRGVLVLLNDEIHPARDVTKTATYRLQTFKAADFGMLGYVDGPYISYYRRSERVTAPETEFDSSDLDALPRVDITYAYAGADGVDVDAYVAAGAKGIVSAGFAPGMAPPGQMVALERAAKAGVVVVQATRAGSGVVHDSDRLAEINFIPADNLNPQKARILLALALTRSSERAEIMRMFKTY
ncbi:asparaginase [Devosia soli]|uniref:Asparaginase n=1 Tax=Devosia soli TaxID=361041 RepID=A0A0F5LFS6_9HYPH|nr:asparaginase [Devosia soli]KKB81193.1 asparaginase [Devosia soli]